MSQRTYERQNNTSLTKINHERIASFKQEDCA